jgi:hypothetical protein
LLAAAVVAVVRTGIHQNAAVARPPRLPGNRWSFAETRALVKAVVCEFGAKNWAKLQRSTLMLSNRKPKLALRQLEISGGY